MKMTLGKPARHLCRLSTRLTVDGLTCMYVSRLGLVLTYLSNT